MTGFEPLVASIEQDEESSLEEILRDYRHPRSCVASVKRDERGRGVLSTGERLAVALTLNRADWLAEENFTIADAIARVGRRWMEFVLGLNRELHDI